MSKVNQFPYEMNSSLLGESTPIFLILTGLYAVSFERLIRVVDSMNDTFGGLFFDPSSSILLESRLGSLIKRIALNSAGIIETSRFPSGHSTFFLRHTALFRNSALDKYTIPFL